MIVTIIITITKTHLLILTMIITEINKLIANYV